MITSNNLGRKELIFMAGLLCFLNVAAGQAAFPQATPRPATPPPPPPASINPRNRPITSTPIIVTNPPKYAIQPRRGAGQPSNPYLRKNPAVLVHPQSVPQPVFAPTPPEALAWDKESKELTAAPGATNILVTFNFTNVHSSEVVIRSVRPSCGCTTVKLPPLPWHIPAGSNDQVTASLDLRGKYGVLTKTLMVDSTSGYKSLLFKVTVPAKITTTTVAGASIDSDRLNKMRMAQVDRQVVFKNSDCAKCHLEPAQGKTGMALYTAACAICHDTPSRATMVPDLKALKFPTSSPYWKYWISNGRAGSLMPAFAKVHGGPLTDQQIQSLVDYLTTTISARHYRPPATIIKPAVPAPASPSAKAVPNESISVFPAPKSN
jgi:Protein of unknown function (DUF1573)/Cytochrome C oxidase, cbb3-type, subunit III